MSNRRIGSKQGMTLFLVHVARRPRERNDFDKFLYNIVNFLGLQLYISTFQAYCSNQGLAAALPILCLGFPCR